jgi:hypothetical protein
MQGPTQGLFLMFGYGNELGWFYKSSSKEIWFFLFKKSILDGISLTNINTCLF